MGSDANDMVRSAVEATLNSNVELAEQVIASDDNIDAAERAAMQKAVIAVMQESPVGEDLRFLVCTLGIVCEIEKVGDHAVKLARRATKLGSKFPSELRLPLVEMGEQVRSCFAASLKLYADYSPELAQEIIEGDDTVDRAFGCVRQRVFGLVREHPESVESLIRTMECFHALEHVADHAVAIAVKISMVNQH